MENIYNYFNQDIIISIDYLKSLKRNTYWKYLFLIQSFPMTEVYEVVVYYYRGILCAIC